jgi:hypothetical protein
VEEVLHSLSLLSSRPAHQGGRDIALTGWYNASCGHSPYRRYWWRQRKFPKRWFAAPSRRYWLAKKSIVNFNLLLHNYIPPWRLVYGVPLNVVIQFWKIFLVVMEPDGSLLCSQKSPMKHYSEPRKSSPHLHILILDYPFRYYSPSLLTPGSLIWSLIVRFSKQYSVAVSFPTWVLQVLPISSFLILPYYVMRSVQITEQ